MTTILSEAQLEPTSQIEAAQGDGCISERAAAFARLAVAQELGGERVTWFRAADPGYPANFSRDGLLNALLAGDTDMLAQQIYVSAYFQGKHNNLDTGEEPGKIHHELNITDNGVVDVSVRGRSTAYNACDTTALFLSSIARLYATGDHSVLGRYQGHITKAIGYIKRHVGADGLFYEFPSGGTDGTGSFGLRVTMWKDSRLNNEHREEPTYPVVYSQVHFQSAAALRDVGLILEDNSLITYADAMTRAGIDRLWRDDHFVSAVDGGGDIDAPSSDSLHSLLYILPNMLPSDYAAKVETYMVQLETPAGYRTGLPVHNGDDYHTRYVWVHEQALLHVAAKLHGLGRAMDVSSRVVQFYGGVYPELIDPRRSYATAGNELQLWGIGTQAYFEHRASLLQPLAARVLATPE